MLVLALTFLYIHIYPHRYMSTNRKPNKGTTGTALNVISINNLARNALDAEIERRRLGKRPHGVHHGHKLAVCEKIANCDDEHEEYFHLIDYRNGNKVLLERPMTRKKAFERNLILRGSGRAWAMIGKR